MTIKDVEDDSQLNANGVRTGQPGVQRRAFFARNETPGQYAKETPSAVGASQSRRSGSTNDDDHIRQL